MFGLPCVTWLLWAEEVACCCQLKLVAQRYLALHRKNSFMWPLADFSWFPVLYRHLSCQLFPKQTPPAFIFNVLQSFSLTSETSRFPKVQLLLWLCGPFMVCITLLSFYPMSCQSAISNYSTRKLFYPSIPHQLVWEYTFLPSEERLPGCHQRLTQNKWDLTWN